MQKSKAQSERNPNRNAEWRKIRETDPPAEALISTSTPAGDPNSLLRAGNKLRLPDVQDRIIVRPRTLPKAAPAPVTPPKAPGKATPSEAAPAKAGPIPPSAPPPWMPDQGQQRGQHEDWTPPAPSIPMVVGSGLVSMDGYGDLSAICRLQTRIHHSIIHLGLDDQRVGITSRCATDFPTYDQHYGKKHRSTPIGVAVQCLELHPFNWCQMLNVEREKTGSFSGGLY